MKKMCDFTFKHYEEILKTAKQKGFKFAFFTEKNSFKKIIYLRHDIDVSLENSLKIAEIEKKNKIYSTFFVRTHSSFYNPLSQSSLRIIKKISDFGHVIGLHYDGDVDLENIENFINKEYEFFRKFIPINKVVSFHCPEPRIFGLELKGFISTYSLNFFKECEYISDSNRELKKGCICDFITKSPSSKIQILTHPIWWNRKSLNLGQLYDNLSIKKQKELVDELKHNTKCYKKFFNKP